MLENACVQIFRTVEKLNEELQNLKVVVCHILKQLLRIQILYELPRMLQGYELEGSVAVLQVLLNKVNQLGIPSGLRFKVLSADPNHVGQRQRELLFKDKEVLV